MKIRLGGGFLPPRLYRSFRKNEKKYYTTVEFADVLGERHFVVFDSRGEAREFMDCAFKRWHFAGIEYHIFTKEQLKEEKEKWRMK